MCLDHIYLPFNSFQIHPPLPHLPNFVSTFIHIKTNCAPQIFLDLWSSSGAWSTQQWLYSQAKLALHLPEADNCQYLHHQEQNFMLNSPFHAGIWSGLGSHSSCPCCPNHAVGADVRLPCYAQKTLLPCALAMPSSTMMLKLWEQRM